MTDIDLSDLAADRDGSRNFAATWPAQRAAVRGPPW